MEKVITGLSREKAYEIKDAIDSCQVGIVAIVDDNKLTIKPTNWDEMKEAFATLNKLESERNEAFIREYRQRHPEV